MGRWRPTELFELALTDEGRPTLEEFRPRAHRRLDSADYPGIGGWMPMTEQEIAEMLERLDRLGRRGPGPRRLRRQMILPWDVDPIDVDPETS